MESETKVDPEDVVRKAYDALNRRDFEAFAATLDKNATVDDPLYGSVKGRDALVKIEKEAFKSVPDVGFLFERWCPRAIWWRLKL